MLEGIKNQSTQVRTTFELLPADVLKNIFQLLGKHEILDLCCVSKTCSYTASKLLYRSILFVSDGDIYDLKDQEPLWLWFQWTVTSITLLETLVDALKENTKLASMIESVYVADTNEIYLLPELLSYTQVRYFHCSDIIQIPRSSLDCVHKLSCCVSSACVRAPQVTELKLIHPQNGKGDAHYAKLSSLMISSGSYRKLKKLCFEVESWNDSSLSCHQWGETVCEYFFTFFKDHKLQLRSLSMNGRFLDRLSTIRAKSLRSGVNLAGLSTLELYFAGGGRIEEASFHSTQFLEAIAPYLRSLTTLSINFGFTDQEDLEQDVKTLTSILRRYLKNKLKSFGVTFSDSNSSGVMFLQEAISQTQVRLQRLQLSSEDMLDTILDYDVLGFKAIRDDLVSRIMCSDFVSEQKPPFWPSAYTESVENNISQIADVMREDLIFKNARQKLPLLDEYYRDGVYFSVKRQGVIVNRILIPFDKP